MYEKVVKGVVEGVVEGRIEEMFVFLCVVYTD